MPRHSALFVLTAALAASVSLPAHADMMFNRVASFAVADNLPADVDKTTPTSSEIITASEDGMTLVYSDSPLGAVGFIDITDPKAPKAGGIVKIDGEPTSVAVAGGKVLAGVNTSESKAKPSGNLAVIDLATKAIESTCDLGGQPDSVALSKDGKFLAIAIENERDEEVNDGEIPQMPAGNLKIVHACSDGAPDCATIKTVDLTGIAEVAPEDPEPEFVAFNEAGEIARHAAGKQPHRHRRRRKPARSSRISPPAPSTLDKIDTKKDGAFSFTGKMENVAARARRREMARQRPPRRRQRRRLQGRLARLHHLQQERRGALRIRPVLRIRGRQCRPLSGRPQQEGRRAGRPRDRRPSAKTS